MVKPSIQKHKSDNEASDNQAIKHIRLSDTFNEEKEMPTVNCEGPRTCPLFSNLPEITNQFQSNSVSACPLFEGIKNIETIKIVNLHLGNYKNTSIIGSICQKSDSRTWNNKKSNGTAISFEICDGTREISVTMFNDQVMKFDECLKINSVVEVTGFRVKGIDSQYQKIPDQKLELILDFSGIIKLSLLSCPTIKFNLCDINQLDKSPACSIADFLGIVYEDGGLHEGISQNRKKNSYRTLFVTDKTKLSYKVKVWRNSAINFLQQLPVTLAISRGKIEVYKEEKSFTANSSSLFWVEPDMTEAYELMKLFIATRKP